MVLLRAGTDLYDVANDGGIDLFIQKLLVFQDFSDGGLSHQVILNCGHHALVEEVGDPLGCIKLIEVIILHAMLNQPINELANSGHWTLLR